ncbi:hypothetical protein J3R30DRAFT_3400315 [Lentinula aciculospora]|uniref:Uncharacterized protein n=1 Tax=Lentinula aciculospora TaxID=153920 RepID=A0A9W9DVV8_9AGAR|nr:hypothetical protein J3R30DRAFT_3404504 [Lentinula aciculospora]KAJ4487596.1 hypothetical protein J3R30DRAFT_3400315 [Lentinula aciculospora]
MRLGLPLTCLVFGVYLTLATSSPVDSNGVIIMEARAGVKPYFVKPTFKNWNDARGALKLPAGAMMDYTSEHSFPAHNGKEIYSPIEFTVNGDGCYGRGVFETLKKSVCDVQMDPNALREKVVIKDAGGKDSTCSAETSHQYYHGSASNLSQQEVLLVDIGISSSEVHLRPDEKIIKLSFRD